MLKLILKNLWARRRRNGWLLAELILVTVLTWYITDPVLVLTYNRSLPLGYNPEGLVIVSLCNLPSTASGYSEKEADSLHVMQNVDRLLRELRSHPDVQSAAPLLTYTYPGSGGSYSTSLSYDTLTSSSAIYFFIPRSGYFETFGFDVLEGKTLQDLDRMDFQQEEVVITDDMTQRLAEGNSLTGKQIYNKNSEDTTFYRVRAMVTKTRSRTFEQGMPSCFQPQLEVDIEDVIGDGKLLMRLKPGVSEQRFLHEFRPWAQSHLRAGNLYVRDAQTYHEQLKKLEYGYGVTNKYRMNVALAFFFLVNLALGVTGTFWLQTRSRRGEVGIMLSYGASPGQISRLLMGEAAILASFAWLVGCLIYLQYGIAEGNWYQQGGYIKADYWINNFWLHYAAVSFIVYVIILFVVLLGVYIPARKISRVSPTEALRDE